MRHCPACQANNQSMVGELSSTFHKGLSRSSFELHKCLTCGTLFQAPLPTENDFKVMYEESDQFSSSEYTDPDRVKNVLSYYAGCFEEMRQLMPNVSPRVLEIGAGWAWVCRVAKMATKEAVTVAQDVSAECARECDWVDQYIVGTLDDRRINVEAPFSIVSLTHVIEHLSDPLRMLKRVRSIVVDDACIFITCPYRPKQWDGSASAWSSWSYNHVPAHLQYLSEDGLAILAAAADMSIHKWMLHEEGQAIEAILRPR